MLPRNISQFKDIDQQEVEPKFENHFTNLQTMCKINIRIWYCFYHNCFGIRHQQNAKSPKLLKCICIEMFDNFFIANMKDG